MRGAFWAACFGTTAALHDYFDHTGIVAVPVLLRVPPIDPVKGWKKLPRLSGRGTKISDPTLEHLAVFTALESPTVSWAIVTDVGIEPLSSLTT